MRAGAPLRRAAALAVGLGLGLGLGLAGPLAAQDAQDAPPTGEAETPRSGGIAAPLGEVLRSPIVTLDADRLFSESQFGQRITADIQAESEALAAENRRIAGELEAEERALTERRPTMTPEAFRAEAEAFDARVQRIRQEQDAKERAIGERVQAAQEAFLNAVRPVLGQLMLERGALVMLDRRTAVLSVSAIDITEAAVARIDAEMGDGAGLDGLAGPAEE